MAPTGARTPTILFRGSPTSATTARIIRNNVVFAGIAQFDTGIGLEQSRGTKVYHNTVVQPASAFASIDTRFASTVADLQNNLFRNLKQRDGAMVTSANNLENAPMSSFVAPTGPNPDLHLVAGSAAIDKGAPLAEGGKDIDGASHDKGAPDTGADDFGAP
jgi:hypothetical protein